MYPTPPQSPSLQEASSTSANTQYSRRCHTIPVDRNRPQSDHTAENGPHFEQSIYATFQPQQETQLRSLEDASEGCSQPLSSPQSGYRQQQRSDSCETVVRYPGQEALLSFLPEWATIRNVCEPQTVEETTGTSDETRQIQPIPRQINRQQQRSSVCATEAEGRQRQRLLPQPPFLKVPLEEGQQPTYDFALRDMRYRIERSRRLQVAILKSVAAGARKSEPELMEVARSLGHWVTQEAARKQMYFGVLGQYFREMIGFNLREAHHIFYHRRKYPLYTITMLRRLEAWLVSAEEDMAAAAKIYGRRRRVPQAWGFPPWSNGLIDIPLYI